MFFMKPNPGSRATDCLGLRGPQPTSRLAVGNGLIMFSWRDHMTKEETTKLFNFNGRYLGTVE